MSESNLKRGFIMIETIDNAVLQMIKEEFGIYADEIIARIFCGESVDSAIQSVLCRG